MDDQLLYTVGEACRTLSIGRTKFYALVASGEIPIRKIGTKTLVASSDLRDWVARIPKVEIRQPTR